MNAHLSNFLEAMVFADENEIDTTQLRADAEKIIAELLISNALAVHNFDTTHIDEDEDEYMVLHEEGSAAFHVGIAATIGDNPEALKDWPSLREYADKIRSKYL